MRYFKIEDIQKEFIDIFGKDAMDVMMLEKIREKEYNYFSGGKIPNIYGDFIDLYGEDYLKQILWEKIYDKLSETFLEQSKEELKKSFNKFKTLVNSNKEDMNIFSKDEKQNREVKDMLIKKLIFQIQNRNDMFPFIIVIKRLLNYGPSKRKGKIYTDIRDEYVVYQKTKYINFNDPSKVHEFSDKDKFIKEIIDRINVINPINTHYCFSISLITVADGKKPSPIVEKEEFAMAM